MISKAKATKGSIQAIDYIMNDKGHAEEISRNTIGGTTAKEIFKELREIQKQNTRCKNNTYSIILSPSNEIIFNKQQLRKLTKAHLTNLNLIDHSWIAYLHKSTDQQHIHIIANRINLKGKAHSDSMIHYKAQNSAQKIAKKLGLKTAKEISEQKRKHKNKTKNISQGLSL